MAQGRVLYEGELKRGPGRRAHSSRCAPTSRPPGQVRPRGQGTCVPARPCSGPCLFPQGAHNPHSASIPWRRQVGQERERERERVRNADPQDGQHPRPCGQGCPRGSVLLSPEAGGGRLHSLSPCCPSKGLPPGEHSVFETSCSAHFASKHSAALLCPTTQGERRPLKRPAATPGLRAQGA